MHNYDQFGQLFLIEMDICHFLELQFRQIVSEYEVSGKIDQLCLRLNKKFPRYIDCHEGIS